MSNLLTRVQAAVRVFKNGYPQLSYKTDNPKPLDRTFLWPDYPSANPEWQITNTTAYMEEGFCLNSLVYSAIMYKVRATATAPLRAYTGTFRNPVEEDRSSFVSQQIEFPNPYQNWIEFHARNMVFLNISGNVYIYKDSETGYMYSLRPDQVWIVPVPNNDSPVQELLGYVYKGNSLGSIGTLGFPILPKDMYHIKLPGPLDTLGGFGYGLSPISPAAHSLDVDNMVTKFINLFFESGALVTGVLSYDVPLKEEVADNIIKRWTEKFGGYENWKVGVLDRGGKFQRIALTFEEMGFESLDSRNEARILGPLGVPPILIGSKLGLDRSTYSNYEAARAAVWEDTLVPELMWLQKTYQKLFNLNDVFVQFDFKKVPALQRTKLRQVDAAYTLYQMGVPRDQAIDEVGLDLSETIGGDLSIVPSGKGKQQGSRVNPDEDSWGR